MRSRTSEQHDLHIAGSIPTWDTALPLGNGQLGALVWGTGHPLQFSLDRADLWDLRPVPEWQDRNYSYQCLRRWVAEGRIDQLHELYDKPYLQHPGPTKIPAGRLEVGVGDLITSRLHLRNAWVEMRTDQGSHVDAFVHASAPLGYIHLTHVADPPDIHLVAPAFTTENQALDFDFTTQSIGSLTSLGYAPARMMQEPGLQSFIQPTWENTHYSVVVGWKSVANDEWLIIWTITKGETENEPLDRSQQLIQAALTQGWEAAFTTHTAWWQTYWQCSALSLPNAELETLWYRNLYLFGAAARRQAPPINLQAIWTADEGGIPPWKGDYHHDLNTELSYWPCYSSNHLDEGQGFLDWLWQTRAAGEAFTQCFFERPGLAMPGATDLLGRPMGGWHQYAFSATTSAWLAQHFYLHWRYSQDPHFLRERAYPYLAEVCTFLAAILEIGPDGKCFLPLSSSPEIHDDRLDAWLPSTTNYDLALIRWAFGAAAELALVLAEHAAAEHWQKLLASCPDFAMSAGRLLVAPGTPLAQSHRHLSHLVAIHPLHLITAEAGEADQRTIHEALAELERLGTDEWCGYTYAWLASLAARGGDGVRAERALAIFANAFCSPNGFHLNGDQSGEGYSKLTYHPFTLEGNFAAAAGIQAMLLQSDGDMIRLFPAIPATWRDVAFTTLRAEGAFLISADRRDGATTRVEIFAECGGMVQLRDPFGGQGFDAQQHSQGTPATTIALHSVAHIIKQQMPPANTLILQRRET